MQSMLDMGLIEELSCERSDHIDSQTGHNNMFFFLEFCKPNAVSKFDAYPVTQVNELLQQ